jgi:hypothetical protein
MDGRDGAAGGEIRFVAATAMLGGGVHAKALRQALDLQPHFIAADGGTTDAGPHALGSGRPAFPDAALKRDLRTICLARSQAGIPALIGSFGTAGTDGQVALALRLVEEIAAEEGLSLRVAAIRSEQDPAYLEALRSAGRILPLDPAPPLGPETFERSERIVGMMGVEPLQAALDAGADLVLAGRCSDPALYAALPILRGLPEAFAWHAGKIAECGTMACVGRNGVLTGAVRADSAWLRPVGKDIRCTPQSVAAHSLYETADPYLQKECSGTLDLRESRYEQDDDLSVVIRGSRFHRAEQYTVKLEGAELVGFQALMIGGIRDPYILRQLDRWLQEVRETIHRVVGRTLGVDLDSAGHRLVFHVYGRNGVMGPLEPGVDGAPHEVGIVVEATAPDQATATQIVQLARQPFLHHGVPEWVGGITSFACLHNPGHVERGPVYRFNLHHVAAPVSPDDMFRMEIVDIVGGRAP